MKLIIARITALAVVLSGLAFVPVASANHSWGGYHWARTSNPFTLKVGSALTSTWAPYLNTTISDWSQSSVLNMVKVSSSAKGKTCKPTSGQVVVCNAAYGNNGWLGIASVWASGTHITQGTVKLNDTYFSTTKYNTPAWRNLVMCQEVGHTLGLDHQDEIFNNANLNTCMDYTNNPATNQHPNAHDYEQLEIIYSHLDAFATVSQSTSAIAQQKNDMLDKSEWGKEVRKDEKNHTSVFENDLGQNHKIFTFVVWAE